MSAADERAAAAGARTSRDFFSELVKGSQPRPEFLAERDRWLRSVQVDGREELLFELEMLLRGIERYFNLHNLPLDPDNPPVVTRDFHDELEDVSDALDRAIRLARRLLDPHSDSKLQFRRYVESQLLADDRARRELMEEALGLDSPQEALFVLRQAFVSLKAVVEHLLQLPLCTYTLFAEVGNLALREIVLNRFFRPFRPLEFRLEYDRIRSVALLEALAALPDDRARRVFTVALLALFRLLHYLSYVGDEERATEPSARVVMALVRSETSTFLRYLRTDAAAQLTERRHRAGALKIAREVSREAERVNQERVAADAGEEFKAALALTALFREQIVTLARVLVPGAPFRSIDELISPQQMAERLRLDLWVFAELCRAAQAVFALDDTGDEGLEALTWLREYVEYFQDVSYHLLRYGDFEAFDRFTQRILALALPPQAGGERARLAEDCRMFAEVAETTFTQVNRRAELVGRPLDMQAAQALRQRYLPAK